MHWRRFDPSVLHDPSWWHWVATVPLLAAHLAGVPWALAAAILLCLLMAAWYAARLRAIQPFPVQIRLAFAALLLAGSAPGMSWLHWVQLGGTSVMVTLGYCLLGRLLMLAPWNRSMPLSLSLLGDALFRWPTAGGILAAECSPPAACSLAGCEPAKSA